MSERVIEYPFVLEWLPKTGVLLDVGPGRHALDRTTELFKKNGIREWIAIDPDPAAHDGVPHFICGSATDHKLFNEAYFDTITCVSTLEHIKEHDACADNMLFWLKSGGTLILTVPFGKFGMYFHPGCGEDMRLYDLENLRFLFPEKYWRWDILQFAKMGKNGEDDWKLCSHEEAMVGKYFPVDRIAMLKLTKV